jgi:formate dehydrogenase (coenzyme F420) beta subunit
MSTTWILKTDGRPLEVVQVFLKGLLEQAQLHGYVIPLYQSDGFSIAPSLVENPDQLVEADPFAPFVEANAAITVVHVDQTRKGERFGTVLRSCEIRAMKSYIQKGLVHPERWLVIGVDCLSSFPAADHDWRVQKAGSIKQLTYDTLRFARQGGIAQYRYRRGCQMCLSPDPPGADICLHVFGLPVHKYVLVQVRDDLVPDLHLERITDGLASQTMVANAQRLRDRIKKRRVEVRLQAMDAIPVDLPQDADDFLELLAHCAPCQKCLDACPIYAGELDSIRPGDIHLTPEVRLWLAACLACGMCEDACPNHLPLTAIKSRIASQQIRRKVAT